ncbi:uncharacterized protein PV09_01734 [Verruconis gallopava]|uniref:Uncharacterized protein n=1 Tax=Verruconis gallopava TaxID=253628 RepID=A0A0D2B986_9PEZI|nr:uncharacterized protein PV09_01734 [Verruconis gallopava]KIW07814.1 hypothetical protein PV09_01734 [Verruconis gallopava]
MSEELVLKEGHQVDDFAVDLDEAQDTLNLVPTGEPPAYADPPAYSTCPQEDIALSSTPPEHATGRLHPRAAVILGLKTHWHKWLFFCRLLSVAPELRFGIPILWKLASFLLGDPTTQKAFSEQGDPDYVFVEVMVAALWCAVSGYVSFFSMDLLMVRWLFHYTPIASIIRLITASFIYYVGTNVVLEYSNSGENPRNLLPSWILVATVLAMVYLTMHDRAAIKREDRSMPVFACASFITMCILVGLLHLQT